MFHPFPAYFFLDDSDVLSIGGAAGPETGLMPGRSTQASLSFLSGTLDSRVAYGRTGPGTYFDANGNLQTAADNVPRFDHSPVSPFAPMGLLIESAKTNLIRNNTMVGAVAGTPGTPPTNWAISGTANGLSYNVVGKGTEQGISYIDIGITGTATASSSVKLATFETLGSIPGTVNSPFTFTGYCRLLSGSLFTGLMNVIITEYDAGGTGLIIGASPAFPATTAALASQRWLYSRSLTNAATASIVPELVLTFVNAQVYNAVIRVGMPQVESGLFFTSVIPTSGSAVSRNQDTATMPLVMTGPNYSMMATFVIPQLTPAGVSFGIVSLSDLSNGNLVRLRIRGGGNTSSTTDIIASTVNQGSIDVTPPAWVVGAVNKTSFAWSTAGQRGSSNGGAVLSAIGATTVPYAACTSVVFGNWGDNLSAPLNGWLQGFRLWPRTLTDFELTRAST